MEGKKSGEGGVVDGETASDSLYEGVSHIGDGGEKVGNDCSTSE